MDFELIEQGLDLMLYGMGMVFSFLVILVLTTLTMSWAVTRFFPEAPQVAPATPPATQGASAPVEATTFKAIQAALDRHRGRR